MTELEPIPPDLKKKFEKERENPSDEPYFESTADDDEFPQYHLAHLPFLPDAQKLYSKALKKLRWTLKKISQQSEKDKK